MRLARSVMDSVRPRGFWLLERIGQAALLTMLAIYRTTLSPILVSFGAAGCRFEPTCSRYTSAAIRHYGAISGVSLGVRRVWRCRPGGGWGDDPLPLTLLNSRKV